MAITFLPDQAANDTPVHHGEPLLTDRRHTALQDEAIDSAIRRADRFTEFLASVAVYQEDEGRAFRRIKPQCETWFSVNNPKEPDGTLTHDAFVELMGFKPAEVPEDGLDETLEIVHESDAAIVTRQVIALARCALIPQSGNSQFAEDALYVSYLARHK